MVTKIIISAHEAAAGGHENNINKHFNNLAMESNYSINILFYNNITIEMLTCHRNIQHGLSGWKCEQIESRRWEHPRVSETVGLQVHQRSQRNLELK